MIKTSKFGRMTIATLLCAAMAFTSVGCGSSSGSSSSTVDLGEGPYGLKYASVQELNLVYGSEATSLHPYGSGTATDWTALSNCIEGLVGTDCYGNYAPALAESWDISDDGLVYTFHLRKGVRWVDVNGKDKGEMVAQDFVTPAQWVCDPANASGSTLYFDGIIEGASALIAGESTDFDSLGFKALDDYTVEITLAAPLPYFLDYCGSYMPVNTELFNSLGTSYGLDNESMYYIGAYILTEFEPQSKRVYEKNESYWDKDNVYITKITMTYNAEATTLAPEMFKRGEIDYAEISSDILDEWMTAEDTKDIVVPGLPDTTYMYYYAFNYMPLFDEEYEPANWNIAVNNENFRQSIYWALDRVKAKLTNDSYNPEMFLSNTITPETWCDVDGVDYTDLEALSEIKSRANYGYDADKALEYKEKAIEELTAAGATFPIKMYMPYNPGTANWELEVQVVAQQLESLLGSDYIECIMEAGPSTGFLTEVRRSGKYGFMRCNNGGSYKDPAAWTIAFGEGNSWTFLDQANGEETQELVQEYYQMVADAKAITEKSTERYTAFAEAEAFLIEHAFVIPYSTDTSGYRVTRYNTLEGVGNGRYKYLKVLEEPLTSEQYDLLYADWQAEREASLANN